MKVLCVLFLMSVSFASWGDEHCPLIGVFKSDAAMTLADMVARSAKSPEAMNFISHDFFGHMTHEWRCREMRGGMDYEDPGAWHEYEVRERDPGTVLVTFPDAFNPDFLLIFEGWCYKVRFNEDDKHYEYFCPVE